MLLFPSSSPAVGPVVVYIDEAADRRLAFEQCFGDHLAVRTVPSAETALALLANHEVAVAVVDLGAADREELLRALRDRSPRTLRVVAGEYVDAERSLRLLDAGLASRHLARPWRQDALVDLLHAAWDERESDESMLSHDLKSPLMTVLANADHLRTLAHEAAGLRDVLLRMPLGEDERRLLEGVLADLQPMSEDLLAATRQLQAMIGGRDRF